MTVEDSKTLYRFKALALISIVMAHTYYTDIQSVIVVRYIHRFCTAGVFSFFFLSGFFFHPTKTSAQEFFKKKTIILLCPWLFCSTVYYCLLVLAKTKSLSILSYINFFVGNGSYFYYLSMLCFCYLFFWRCYNKKAFLMLAIALTAISTILTAVDIIPTMVNINKWPFTYSNPYLNPFNWIGIFGLGLLFQQTSFNMHRLLLILKNRWVSVLLVSTTVYIILVPFDNKDGYWSYFSLIIEAVLGIGLLCLACGIEKFQVSRLIEYIGKLTLPIYLIHMPIQNRLFTAIAMKTNPLFAIIRPIVTILMLTLFLHLYKRALNLCPKSIQKIGHVVLGLHEKENG